MPHCATETPVSSSLGGCELAFRAIVAFEHALDPVARSYAWTHTHTHTHARIYVYTDCFGPLPQDTRPLKRATPLSPRFSDEFRSTDPIALFWDTRPKRYARPVTSSTNENYRFPGGSNSMSRYCISKGIPSRYARIRSYAVGTLCLVVL